ncbi:MAG: hypothetical protein J6D16_03600 [Clostridia bacterium]|nr:hypothetical protein [Clostridia bacterium]
MLIKILKKSFIHASCAYSILSIFYLIIMMDLYRTSANPYPLTLLRFFPLCFFIALANALVTEIKTKGAWKLPVHFTILSLALILFVWLPFKDALSPSSSLILALIYIILYAIGALIVSRSVTKKKETTSEYRSVYSNDKRK